jgi:hypothetical protein
MCLVEIVRKEGDDDDDEEEEMMGPRAHRE